MSFLPLPFKKLVLWVLLHELIVFGTLIKWSEREVYLVRVNFNISWFSHKIMYYFYVFKIAILTIVKVSKVGDSSRGQLEGSLFISYYTEVLERALLHFTLDLYFIMLNIKQGIIKYHILSLWYDSTWDWTPVRSPEPLAITLCTRSTDWILLCIYLISYYIYIYIYILLIPLLFFYPVSSYVLIPSNLHSSSIFLYEYYINMDSFHIQKRNK